MLPSPEAAALSAERGVSGRDQRAAGQVRLSATEMRVTRFIAPYVARFGERYPDVTLELERTNRSVNLTPREADIALRLARPREDGVVTKRLASVWLALYASRGYLERRGAPVDPEASLAGHPLILFAASRLFAVENDWLAARLEGAHVALRSDRVSSIYAATLAGMGVALSPRAVADWTASGSAPSRPRRPSRAPFCRRCTWTRSAAPESARCSTSSPRCSSASAQVCVEAPRTCPPRCGCDTMGQ